MRQAVEQIPRCEQAAEAVPLQRVCQRARHSRRPGPQAIGEILVAVLARLGVGTLQYNGRQRLRVLMRTCSRRASDNAIDPMGSATSVVRIIEVCQARCKVWRSVGG